VSANESVLQVIPLGGLGEIGKNMTAFRYLDTIVLIDSGLMFPEDELLGIDVVIPNYTYLLENRDCFKAIFLTHGHEDHVGALPYILKEFDVPVYGSKLTLGIVAGKLKEHGISTKCLHEIRARGTVTVGPFKAEFFRVSHSIPDAMGIGLHTPLGIVVHTGDFKLDHTPVDGNVMDFSKISEFSEKKVLLLLSDSTNSERPGITMSEKVVGEAFCDIFARCEGRIIVTTFASNVHRIQQAIDTAVKFNRQVAVMGRSMVNNVAIAQELGYMHIPEGTLIEPEKINRCADAELVIVTTGSQGEPLSALSRMASSEHRWVEIRPGDTVVISATPIPGNEKMVSRTIDLLYKQGAEVIADKKVHVSGHASEEEMKIMLNLIRPRYFMPVHGEYRHLMKHAHIAESLGIPRQNIFVGENGQILEIGKTYAKFNGKVTSGKILIDGLGVGDVGNIVLRDRRQLSQDGIMIVVVTLNKSTGLVVSGPDIVTRGFVYVRESEELMDSARGIVKEALDSCGQKTDWGAIKSKIREKLSKHLYDRTGRRPMILPIVMEV
jgi:ribonuclease J